MKRDVVGVHVGNCPAGRTRLSLRVSAPLPSRRDAPLDRSNEVGWLGTRLVHEKRSVVLVGAQRVGLPPGTRQRLDQQASRPVPQRVGCAVWFERGNGLTRT